MRVGIFSWESLYSVKIGGIAPHVSELSEALVKRGHEVHIFTRRGDFDVYDIINGVHYHRVAIENLGNIVFQMDKMCDALFESFERAQNEMKKLAYEGYNRIDAEFGWDSIASKPDDVYNEALKRYNASDLQSSSSRRRPES